MSAIGFNQVSFNYSQFNFNNLSLSASNMATAQRLLSGFSPLDLMDLAKSGSGMGSMMEMMLPRPAGFLGGNIGQTLAHMAGFMDGLKAASMMQGGFMGGLPMMGAGALYGGMSITNIHGEFGAQRLTGPDKFGYPASCTGNKDSPSNLQNSPHVQMALYNILKNNADSMPAEELQKQLKDKYGIESEVSTFKGENGVERKALKFPNGDMLVDSSGNGAFGTADYNLKGAVDDIQKRMGVSPEDFEKTMSGLRDKDGKYQGPDINNFGMGGSFDITNVQAFGGYAGMMPLMSQFGNPAQLMGMAQGNFDNFLGLLQNTQGFGGSMFPMQQIAGMFSMAMTSASLNIF